MAKFKLVNNDVVERDAKEYVSEQDDLLLIQVTHLGEEDAEGDIEYLVKNGEAVVSLLKDQAEAYSLIENDVDARKAYLEGLAKIVDDDLELHHDTLQSSSSSSHGSYFGNSLAVLAGTAMCVAGVAACLGGAGIAVGALLLTVGQAVINGFMSLGLSAGASFYASAGLAGIGAGLGIRGLYGLFKHHTSREEDDFELGSTATSTP